jgi:hypothetical protein
MRGKFSNKNFPHSGHIIKSLYSKPERLRSRSPSPLRPKKPPKLATIQTASLKPGGFGGGIGLLVLYATNDFHSASSKNTVHGTSGTSMPSFVK